MSCTHPEHRRGTHGRLRSNQEICMQCGTVVPKKRSKTMSKRPHAKRSKRAHPRNSAETHAAIAEGKEPGALARIMAGPTPVSKGRIGAVVQYCGHDATFIADIIQVGDACVVIANGEIHQQLVRPASGATHHLHDFPKAGYWNPQKGFFVVPSSQVVLL